MGRVERAIRAYAWRSGVEWLPQAAMPELPRVNDSAFAPEAVQTLLDRLLPMPSSIECVSDAMAFMAHVVANDGFFTWRPGLEAAAFDGYGPDEARHVDGMSTALSAAMDQWTLNELLNELLAELLL